jgi:hypothetical protein
MVHLAGEPEAEGMNLSVFSRHFNSELFGEDLKEDLAVDSQSDLFSLSHEI